jgi:hypothetical protein
MEDTTSQAMQPAPASPTLPGPGAMLQQAWDMFKTHWKTLLGITLVGWLLMAIIALIFFGSEILLSRNLQSPEVISPSGITFFIGLVLVFMIAIIQQAALVYKVGVDNNAGIMQSIRGGLQRAAAFFIAGLLGGIAIILGFILLIIPGIIVLVWFALAGYVVVIEGASGIQGLQRSKELVKGYWWATFGRILFWIIIAILVSIVTGLISSVSEPLGSIVNSLISLLITPLAVIYMYLLYRSLKQIKGSPDNSTV